MQDHSAKFLARVIWLDTDGIVELEVWDDELTPVGEEAKKRCSVRMWVENDFRDCCDDDWFREEFELGEGGYEIVFEGQIRAWLSGYPGEEEWDEEIIVSKYAKQKLPDDFFDYLDTKDVTQNDIST